MAHILEDRVLEQSTTTGTGAFTLAGAALGFRAFSAVCSVADTCWYYIEGIDSLGKPSGAYEYGIGTYSGANTLTRTTVRGSSNGGAAVNFAAGTKLVGIGILAPRSSSAKQWREAFGMYSAGKVSLKHYCVGDGATDDQAAIQAIITAQEAAGDTVAFEVDAGYTFFVGSTLTFTKRPLITGGGKLKCTGNFPIFTFNINTTTVNFWRVDCEFEGPVTTNTSSCAILITGDDIALFQHGQANIVTNGFNAGVKDVKTARVTVAGLESMCNWNRWNVDMQSPANYGFWLSQGSGTGNIVDGVIIPRLNTGACMFYDGVGNVVGDVIVSGHWGCQVAGGTGVKIGASTVYRAQWDLSRIQFDANCDTPLSMSGTGAAPYRNFNFGNNNLGGATTLGAGLQPLYSSIVDDRDVSRWYAGKYNNTATVGALSVNVFTIDFAQYGAGTFEIWNHGLLGGVGSRYGFAEFDIIESGGSLTVTAARAARGIFVISITTSGTTATVKWTATSTGAGTDTNATMRGIGHGFKVTRA